MYLLFKFHGNDFSLPIQETYSKYFDSTTIEFVNVVKGFKIEQKH